MGPIDEQPPPMPDLPEPPAAPGLRRETPVGRRPAPTSPARRRAGMFAVLGGSLVVIGVFLPWVSATGPLGTVTESGFAMGSWGMLLLGGFAVMRGLSMSRPDRFRVGLGSPLLGGVLLAVLMVARWNDIQSFLRDMAPNTQVAASLGIGVWFTIVGILLILAGGVLGLRRRG